MSGNGRDLLVRVGSPWESDGLVIHVSAKGECICCIIRTYPPRGFRGGDRTPGFMSKSS